MQLAEKKLKEAAEVGLSSSSCDFKKENVVKGSGSTADELEFESLSSYTRDEINKMVSDVNEHELIMNSSQDPNIEDVILGLVSQEREFNNPFQVSEEIRQEMIRQAEVAGGRALEWGLSSFDQIGGPNTLRRVWARLKGDQRVRGRKRSLDIEGNTSDVIAGSMKKKKKISSNVSSTCDLLSSIFLSGDELEGSLIASEASTDEVFLRDESNEQMWLQ